LEEIMKYRPLGRTGLHVSPFALGAMMFSSRGNGDQSEVDRMVARALDAGINLVDTADAYGESEEMLGRALRGRRDEVVLASKFSRPLDDDVNHRGGSRRWIMTAVEGTLRRLGTDHLDVYQMHRPDPATDVEETLSALTDLVRSGKVRTIGSSDMPASPSATAWAR
jgi:aryl-alcohol dehydrogenase-like predicted oxidoreductase